MDLDAAARAQAMSYKLRKEAFVSNLSGSSLTDINLVTLVAASAILLWTALSKRGIVGESATPIAYTLDFLLNVCAILFAFTLYSSTSVFLNLALVVPAVLLLLPLQPKARKSSRTKPSQNVNNAANTREKHDSPLEPGTLIVRPFLTNYRGSMLIATAIAILAVDFRIFPRRFAKCETWGTSLMDLGVGSFVFSNGIVSARAVIREQQKAPQTHDIEIVGRMTKACRHSVPLVFLGLARLVSVKNLDYAEHLAEYGYHWNFFFTLALLPPFVETVDCSLALLGIVATDQVDSTARSIRYDVVALLISLAYESILNSTGLLSFILISPRTSESSLLAKNREGIFSFFGYLGIFLSGRSTGILTCQFHDVKNKHAKPLKGTSVVDLEARKINRERNSVMLPQLLLRAVVFAALYYLATSIYVARLTVSRRLANLPYVLWILAYNNAQLCLFALVEAVGPKFVFSAVNKQTVSNIDSDVVSASEVASPVMRAFNKNGLAVFLISNLGTGLVNLTVNTLDTSNTRAMGVLMIYAGALTTVAVGMHRAGINIRL